MKEYLEVIYDSVINAMANLCEFAKEAFFTFVAISLYLTTPLWILPYHFWKKYRKGGDEE